MKKGQIGEGTVLEVRFPNKGIVQTQEGELIVVKNTLPGQKVAFAVNKARKGKAEGSLLEVLERSPLEEEAGCPHYGVCGGCTCLSLPYEKQLEMKAGQVEKILKEALGDSGSYEFLGIRPSPKQYGYRNKMEFSFGDEFKDGPLALGMHKRGSFYDIVTVSGCRIADEDFRRILLATLEFFARREVSYYHRLRHTGYLRHLLVRKAEKTGEILVDLVTTTQTEEPGWGEKAELSEQIKRQEETISEDAQEAMLNDWAEMLLELPLEGKLRGILHTRNDSVADVVKNEGTEILHGEDFFVEELLGLRFRITPFSFFQTNSLGAEVLYRTAREFILADDPDALQEKVVYDLYSGTGTIAQMMAPVCREVVGVEIVEEAVEAARENAKRNGLENCRFLAGDVLKVLDTIDEKPDYIILDPPRDGVHPKALEKILDYGVEHMVYISCKPTSLARDLEVFAARGYAAEKVCCVDMFPGTANIETVVQLSKGEIDSKKVRVEFSLEDMDMSGFQKGATYGKIKAYVKEHTGLTVSSLYIAQVKQKCGIIERENYNKPRAGNTRQPQCPPEKEAAIREALEHFGMI